MFINNIILLFALHHSPLSSCPSCSMHPTKKDYHYPSGHWWIVPFAHTSRHHPHPSHPVSLQSFPVIHSHALHTPSSGVPLFLSHLCCTCNRYLLLFHSTCVFVHSHLRHLLSHWILAPYPCYHHKCIHTMASLSSCIAWGYPFISSPSFHTLKPHILTSMGKYGVHFFKHCMHILA